MDKRGVVVLLSAGLRDYFFVFSKYLDWIGGPLIILFSWYGGNETKE
jgi:hypothetical protein